MNNYLKFKGFDCLWKPLRKGDGKVGGVKTETTSWETFTKKLLQVQKYRKVNAEKGVRWMVNHFVYHIVEKVMITMSYK